MSHNNKLELDASNGLLQFLEKLIVLTSFLNELNQWSFPDIREYSRMFMTFQLFRWQDNDTVALPGICNNSQLL